ncbi:DUF6429 family protein [Sutcliffiella horikoshii]
MRQGWKGYDFEILNQLSEREFIGGGNRSKSVYLTEGV